MPVAQSLELVRQVAQGLSHAHENQIMHRDIKPANLIFEGSTVKILDLGLARKHDVDESLTSDGAGMGTPDYMSLEQLGDAHNADIRSDLYALGCTWYHLPCGQPPFAGGSVFDKAAAHARKQAVPVDQRVPGVPASIAAIIARLMAKRPEERFQSPRELLDVLAAIPAGDQPSTLLAQLPQTVPETLADDDLTTGNDAQTPAPVSTRGEVTLVRAPGWSTAAVLIYALPLMAALVLGGAYFGIKALREMDQQKPLVIEIPADSGTNRGQREAEAKVPTRVVVADGRKELSSKIEAAEEALQAPEQPVIPAAGDADDPAETDLSPAGATAEPTQPAQRAPAKTWMARTTEDLDQALEGAQSGDAIELEPGKRLRLLPRKLEDKELTLRSSKARQRAALVFELPAGTEKPEGILTFLNGKLQLERIDVWFSVLPKAHDPTPVALVELTSSDLELADCSVTIVRGTVESAMPVMLALAKGERPWNPRGGPPQAVRVELRDCVVRGAQTVVEARGRQLRLVFENSILCGPGELIRLFHTEPLEWAHQAITLEIGACVVDVAGPIVGIECRPYALRPVPLQIAVRSSFLCNSRPLATADLPPQVLWQSPVEEAAVTTALRWQGERNGYLQRADGLRIKTAAGPVAVLVQSPDEWQRQELGAEVEWKLPGAAVRLPRTPWHQRTAADYRPARKFSIDLDRLRDPPRQPPKR
jgi:hypothetical protein